MITLNTIAYEGNFNQILDENSWFIRYESKYITKKLITVNNLSSVDRFKELLKQFPQVDVVYVSDHKDNVIEKYKLNINESSVGYNYTIPYFVAMEGITTKYMLNIASDCMIDIVITDDFFEDSIFELETNPHCSTTTIAWIKDNVILGDGRKVAETEEIDTRGILGVSNNRSEKFNCRACFTDQFYLGSIDKLRNIDYSIDIAHANMIYHGPIYCGTCFERRMVANHVKNHVYNCVHKNNNYYIHTKL